MNGFFNDRHSHEKFLHTRDMNSPDHEKKVPMTKATFFTGLYPQPSVVVVVDGVFGAEVPSSSDDVGTDCALDRRCSPGERTPSKGMLAATETAGVDAPSSTTKCSTVPREGAVSGTTTKTCAGTSRRARIFFSRHPRPPFARVNNCLVYFFLVRASRQYSLLSL